MKRIKLISICIAVAMLVGVNVESSRAGTNGQHLFIGGLCNVNGDFSRPKVINVVGRNFRGDVLHYQKTFNTGCTVGYGWDWWVGEVSVHVAMTGTNRVGTAYAWVPKNQGRNDNYTVTVRNWTNW